MAHDSTQRRGVASGRRRRPLAALNLAGRVLERAGVRAGLDEARLHEVAARQAGSDDFGDDGYREPLRVLLGALEREAALSPFGRFAARSQVVTLLANRARMQDWWRRHPEILDAPVVAPWFVLGLPRSGTTLFQQLLALDPGLRSLYFWEATAPAPPPDAATAASDPRIRAARRAQRLLDLVAPDANAVHPVGAEGPTECVSLLAHSFASLEFGAINHVPGHLAWCLGADLAPHYAYYRRQLQLLQWHRPAPRWALKSPAHLVALDALLATFPDARVVWLHRDPVTAVTSHCSLVAILRAIGTDRVDLAAVGREWPDVWARALDRALDARTRAGEDRFVDVAYRDLVADPVGTVARVYARLGAPLAPVVETRMRGYVAGHPQSGRGVHSYTPADFSLDTALLRHRVTRYTERFARELAPEAT